MFTQRSLRTLISLLRRDETPHSGDDEPTDTKWEDTLKETRSFELYHSQLSEISEELKLVEDRRTQLLRRQKMVNRSLNTMVSVNRLPPEVLGEILELSIHVSDNRLCAVWDSPALSTCHLWRAIVLKLSALWSQISISETTPWEQAATWVRRAGNRPLDIYLVFPPEYSSAEFLKEKSKRVISAWNLVPARRIQYLSITGCIEPSSIFPLKRDTTNLQTLIVRCEVLDTPQVAQSSFTIFPSHIPHSLKIMVVDSEDENLPQFTLCPIEAPDLSHLEILSFAGDIKLLDMSKMLATCHSLKGMRWDYFEGCDGPRITLPNLEHLVIVDPEVLRFLELPKLHTLTLDEVLPRTPNDLLRLTSLKKLVVFYVSMIDDLTAFLDGIPHVVHLKFERTASLEPILEALCQSTPGTTPGTLNVPCPNLRVLECVPIVDFNIWKPLLELRALAPSSPLEIWLEDRNPPEPEKWEEWMEQIHWDSTPADDEYSLL
ncbi:hypothetical protein DL93DRAFT_2074638 [Clavulina sp. PMI_390]|nr:hypothetical protein DL93DRAFT_2074638 [Clavulina sp. PMI_390]